MNSWHGIGRLCKDVDYRAGETSVAKYTLAVDRKYNKEGQTNTDFISIVAFGKSADFANKYFKKGMKVAVSGRIQTGSYTNKDGQKVYTTDIIIEDQEFAESKSSSSENTNNSNEDFMTITQEMKDDMPF